MTRGWSVNVIMGAIAFCVLLLTLLLFAFRRYNAGKMPRPRQRIKAGPPDARAETEPVSLAAGAHDQVLRDLQIAQAVLADEIRALAEVLVQREITAQASSGMREQLGHLAAIYEQAAQHIDPFISAVQQLRPTVALLGPFAAEAGVAEIMAEYEGLAGIGGGLRENSASMRLLENSSELARQAAVDFRAGIIPAHEYLRAVYTSAAPACENLPSITEEQTRMAELTGSAEERLLNWIDSVSELRNMAVAGAHAEVRDACSRLIAHADEIIEAWNIKLIDVTVGSTLYDSRLHDLGGTLPRSDVRPETIIGVRRLGHKRNGIMVRRPVVLVAAASAAV